MEFKTQRDARFILIKDQLTAIAERLGYLSQADLNAVGEISIGENMVVTIKSMDGIGMRIRHTMHVTIEDTGSDDYIWAFTVDVLGKNQCKNCWFPSLPNYGKGVDHLTDEEWEDYKWLPELFADAVEAILFERYKAK